MNTFNNDIEGNNVSASIEYMKGCAETVASKRLEQAVDALKLTEASFKVRCEEKGHVKGTESFDSFKREYNRACNLKTQLVATGMDTGRGAYTLSYGNPNKHKGRLSGGVRQDSLLFRALEYIRTERIEAFHKSHKAGQEEMPIIVELTDAQWIAVALAQYCVPMRFAIEGKLNTEAGKAYLAYHETKVWARRSAMNAARNEMDATLNAAGVNITADDDNEPMPAIIKGKGKNKKAA